MAVKELYVAVHALLLDEVDNALFLGFFRQGRRFCEAKPGVALAGIM